MESSERNGVSVQETAFLVGMTVQIKESIELLSATLNQTLDSKARRLLLFIRQMVEPVQVLSEYIHPIVSIEHPIWV